MDPPLVPPRAAVSIGSSPRSRKTNSFDDSLPPVPGASKLRLMCSYGGRIVPRPHDKSLCYVGGDTRMVAVDRYVSFAGFSARVAKTLYLQTKPFCLKYQLPNEDLDSLISLAGDEDLENMIDEYDRICAAAVVGRKGSRLRLFVFPAKSIGSLIDNSVNSDELFLSAFSESKGFSDSASINYLLGLENESDAVNVKNNELVASRGLDSEFGNDGKNVKILNQDVHSVLDSPMMETNSSSFGSDNSTSLANLPPIRVREGRRMVTEEQFAEISVCVSDAAEKFSVMSSRIPTAVIASMPVQSTVMTSSAQVVGDFQNRVVSDDERSDHGIMLGHGRKSPQQQSLVQLQQRPSSGADSPKQDSLRSDGSIPNITPRSNQMGYQEVVQVSSVENRIPANLVDQRNNLIDLNNAPVQLQKPVQGSGYMVRPQTEPQQYSYPQQIVHAGMHYVVQQQGNPMAIPSFYPMYPPRKQVQHPSHQPIQLQPQQYHRPIYIVQAPPPSQGYSMSMQQHTYPESTDVVHNGHIRTQLDLHRVPDFVKAFGNNPNVSGAPPNTDASSAIYRTTSAAAQPMIQEAPNLPQPQFVNYSQVNQHPQVTSTPNPGYEISDPARAQIYYTQPLAPSIISQYQTMSSAQVMEAASSQTWPHTDSMKPPQIKSS